MSRGYIDGTDNDSVKERGGIVDRALKGKFGEILFAFINALKDREFTFNQENSNVSADRRLGRCEGYTNIINGLGQMIADKDILETPVRDDEE